MATAGLYLWNLGTSGWANAYYSAAVQAGSQNWTAMFFGSSDGANAITVDKPPAALWVMDVSARLFGVNAWSVLVPQALMGVAAVAVLFASVRRVAGPGAGLLAGAVLALTPVAALMFRFNNPDALLVLLLVVAAYCTQRACEKDASRWWLIAAGVAVGFGFLAKMLQALLVLPAFAATYLVAAQRPGKRRILDCVAALAAVVVSAGWYVLVVDLWPKELRPYIGGSQTNSILELTLGYNGFGRLTGNEPGGLGNLNHDVGWGRLFGFGMGADIAWLLPAALICIAGGFVVTWRRPRTDPTRAALILWGGWLVVTAVVFSYMNGIVHPYYTVALAPAIGAGIGIGATLLWRRRADIRAATTLASVVAVSAVLAAVLLGRHGDWMPWLRAAIAVGGVGAAALLVVVGRLPRRAAVTVAGLAVVSCLAGPAAFSVATALSPHTGALPSVGPSRGGPSFSGGGLLSAPQPHPGLISLLAKDADDFTWAAAVVGSNNAAGYQLATGAPVMAVGGFNGTDPSPTLAQFVRYVDEGSIHYFVVGPTTMMGHQNGADAHDSAAIRDWVEARYPEITVDGTVVYDLTQKAVDSQPAHSSGPR
ncbi:glycosyltransferase family 39 protein [Mycobacterium sp. 236(2023)]|uniref:glycosyltransferase family 39 protein n=1 Tax=Mycobacterium sp. 236(2023) TaxID=3038163 RepID=UPI002414F6BE|nr:glycosyltransferase family 39 protein [Mycobacterium sp. 236(2023)]MDG4666296.1 glycosyltransferase family 39 protein [Mycobacterium sp. 236(2023)]